MNFRQVLCNFGVGWGGVDPYWTLIGPWPSGAGGDVSGAGPGTLGTPGPMEPGSLKGLQVQRHWPRCCIQHVGAVPTGPPRKTKKWIEYMKITNVSNLINDYRFD